MFAADLAGLLAGPGVKSAHMVGISLGGAVALQFALDYSTAIKTLTVVNSGPSLGGTLEQAQQENAELAVMANAHHAVPIERPQEFNAVLAPFLAKEG